MYVAEKKLLKIVPEFCLLPDELLCKEKWTNLFLILLVWSGNGSVYRVSEKELRSFSDIFIHGLITELVRFESLAQNLSKF
jgi:hypothetical protein